MGWVTNDVNEDERMEEDGKMRDDSREEKKVVIRVMNIERTRLVCVSTLNTSLECCSYQTTITHEPPVANPAREKGGRAHERCGVDAPRSRGLLASPARIDEENGE